MVGHHLARLSNNLRFVEVFAQWCNCLFDGETKL